MAEDSFVKKVRMGKRIEKAFGRDKGQVSSASTHDQDDDPNKTPEPHVCSGHFANDFTELCKRNLMIVVPPVVLRPKRPPSPAPQAPPDEKPKGGKKDDKKNPPPPPEPEPEAEVDENGDPFPKTYTTKNKFEFFKPSVQVEMDNPDKLDTVTEVFIRGWKVDEPMMTVFKQCWVKMDRLHTVNLWNAGLTDETLDILASFLPECANVKTVILDSNPVKGEGYHKLLKEESLIQHLSLRYNQITDTGLELMIKGLGTPTKSNTKLVSLNVNGNRITDKGVELLANALRMNRTLVTIGLANNQIGDEGARRFAEVLSRFKLTHEEIVERRRLLSEKGAPDGHKSATPGSRRSESRDRPGSVRSMHAGGASKAGKSAKSKKDGKNEKEEKHDKTKGGKKEAEKSTKKDTKGAKASLVADQGKTTTKGKEKGKGKKSGPTLPEHETPESPEMVSPLLDEVEKLKDGTGTILLSGNRALISLNLAYNQITEEGAKALLAGIRFQNSLLLMHENKAHNPGLMRLCLNKNKLHRDSDTLKALEALLGPKDPFFKPPPGSPDRRLCFPLEASSMFWYL